MLERLFWDPQCLFWKMFYFKYSVVNYLNYLLHLKFHEILPSVLDHYQLNYDICWSVRLISKHRNLCCRVYKLRSFKHALTLQSQHDAACELRLHRNETKGFLVVIMTAILKKKTEPETVCALSNL